MERPNRRVVVGVGNLLLKDEGIGVHVAHALQSLNLPQGVEIIDGGTSADPLVYLGPVEKLVIVDAVQTGSQPGTIYRFHPSDLARQSGALLSVHEMSLTTSLEMMNLLGQEAQETVIIGVQIKDIGWGTELSRELQEKVSAIVRIILEEIDALQ